MEPVLNSERVCELLRISRATLSRMVKAGEIPYILRRQGKRKKMVMFNEALLEKWLASRTRVAAGMRMVSPGRPLADRNKVARDEPA